MWSSMGAWKEVWAQVSAFLRLDDLCVFRRVCKALCKLVGPSFLSFSRFSVVPNRVSLMETNTKYERAVELFRHAGLPFSSVPATDWSFWCSQLSESVDIMVQRSNVEVLHLNSVRLVAGRTLRERFHRLHTVTFDSVLASACFDEKPYEAIHTVSILPPRSDLNLEELAQSVLENPESEIVVDVASSSQNVFAACVHHFNHLVFQYFPALQRISYCASAWQEIVLLYNTLRERRRHHANDRPPITHLLLSSSSTLAIPEGSDLLSSILLTLPELEELRIDTKITCTVIAPSALPYKAEAPVVIDLNDETAADVKQKAPSGDVDTPVLTSAEMRCLHVSVSCQDSPVFAFPKLETLALQVPNPQHCVLFGPLPSLTDLELAAPFHVLSLLLDTIDPSSLPVLKTLKFYTSILEQSAESLLFKVGNMPVLEELIATFNSEVPFQTVSLQLSGEVLRTLTLNVQPNIWIQRLDLDTNMESLEKLIVVSGNQPRASATNRVIISSLPSTLKTLSVPAQWCLSADSPAENAIVPVDVTSTSSDVLFLSTFFQIDAMQLHTGLSTLCLQVLSEPEEDFLELFAHVLPIMPNLTTCLLRLVSPSHHPSDSDALPIHHLRSKSLNMLNIKLLPTIFAKPNPQATIGGSQNRTVHSASALDPNLAVTFPGHNPAASGRANCQVTQCMCSGYSRDTLRRNAPLTCSTLGCGHAANEHRAVADIITYWLSISLECPKLTHLAVAGLSVLMDISTVIKRSPILTHLQVSLSQTPERLTIAHPTLSTLHLGRLDQATVIHMNLPKLVRLFVEACPVLTSIHPLPLPNLETVYIVSSSAITPECRLRLERTNPKGGAKLIMAYPKKTQFPDYFPTL